MGSMTEHATATHEAEIDNSNRSTTPRSESFLDYISSHWADREDTLPETTAAAGYARTRRDALGAQFTGKRLVLEAGILKQRSNDTFYPFRAHSAFSHLTGWGSEAEPGAILVLDPITDADTGSDTAADADTVSATHEATLYFRERAGRDSDEFFANPEIGEFWIGARPSLQQVSALLGVRTAHLAEFTGSEHDVTLADEDLARAASELRLVKDDYEITEMQSAIDATAQGFNEVLAALGDATAHPRGERIIESVFNYRARLDGNEVGYDTIAASGPNACTLHWTRNDGPVRDGDLLLLDAGIEMDSLYTADITRTIPISGTFSDVQRRVYNAVLEAADAARAIVRPGIRFHEVHSAAMAVIEQHTREWDFLPEDGGTAYHRRYMVHGTSHHLGLDVHDCAQARRDMYMDGVLEEGMIFTIEPGLYFQPDDLTVPAEYRGIGVRVEDDIVVTAGGCVNMSANIPRTADDVEAWVRRERGL